MQVVIGSYDGLVAGYALERSSKNSASGESCIFVPKFNDASHLGCVRSVEISSKGILASGSTDETIHLFNLERSTSIGSLVSHEGDVTCLKYAGKDFLYSGSADGTIRMWRTRIWELQRTFKGHKGAVLSFDIHASKKLALSVGADKKLIAWDLVAGKYSFIRNMKKLCEAVVFSKSGARYAVRSGSTVDIYNLTATDIIFSEDLKCRINDVVFLGEEAILIVCDSNSIHIFDISTNSVIMKFEAHKVRVRAAIPVETSTPDHFLLTTCSSDETIKAWSLDMSKKQYDCIASINTNCRITGLAVHAPSGSADRLLAASFDDSTPVTSIKKKKTSLKSKGKNRLPEVKKSVKFKTKEIKVYKKVKRVKKTL